jgi:hypothetical protein
MGHGEAMRRQPRRNHDGGDGPHPGPILRGAGAAEDSADGALTGQHVVVVTVARRGAEIGEVSSINGMAASRQLASERGLSPDFTGLHRMGTKQQQ